jgi:putative ABC transport system permease protein
MLRKGLVIFQFLASVVLITGTWVVFQQLDHLRSRDLGVKIDQTLVIETARFNSDSVFNIRDEMFQNELMSMVDVKGISRSNTVPGGSPDWNAGGIHLLSQSLEESNQFRIIACDDRYVDFFELKLIAGRNFDKNRASEAENVLMNETAMRRLGISDPEKLMQERLQFWGDTFNIVGVVKDYRQESPKQAYDGYIYRYFPSPMGYYSVAIRSENMRESIGAIRKKWEAVFDNKPLEYFFLDEHYNEQYNAEVQFGSIFGIFAGLAIFVACLGLFGLVSFVTHLRTKEVGVRKVVGASDGQVWVLLTRDFMKLVVLAIILSVPLSYFLMDNWLQEFASRIELGAHAFVVPSLILIGIAMLTVSYHTYRTARIDPAIAVKDE